MKKQQGTIHLFKCKTQVYYLCKCLCLNVSFSANTYKVANTGDTYCNTMTTTSLKIQSRWTFSLFMQSGHLLCIAFSISLKYIPSLIHLCIQLSKDTFHNCQIHKGDLSLLYSRKSCRPSSAWHNDTCNIVVFATKSRCIALHS